MLLAEELVLLGLDPVRGTLVNQAGPALHVGVSGALIGELALRELVTVADKRFVVNGTAPAEPLLRDAYAELATGKGRRTKPQLRRLDRALGGGWSRVVDGLVDQQVIERRRHRMLLWHVTRHPVRDLRARDEVLERVRRAARGDGEIEPGTAVLLALSGPCRLLEVVAPERASRAHARERIEQAAALTPVAPVVKSVIADVQAAVAAGAVVAATAATSG